MDPPAIPKRPRSRRPIFYRFGQRGSSRHIYYRLSRFLSNTQGGLFLENETRALARVQLSIRGAYLPKQKREPEVITAGHFSLNHGPLNEKILQFLLLQPVVESVALHGANRDRGAQIVLQDNDQPDHAKLKELVSHVTQVLEFLCLFGRRTLSFEDLRVIVDNLFPQSYNGDDWGRFVLRGHLIIVIITGTRAKRAVIRHSLNGGFFYSVAKVHP